MKISQGLIKTLKNYNLRYLKNDISSGISVATVSLPQIMGYALIAGLNPIYGIYTFIVSTIMATVVGVSDYMIVGPTNIIAVVIASSLNNLGLVNQSNYIEIVFLLTFLVGVIQIILGSLKLGNLVNYVSQAVIVGLTTGVAILIGVGQLNKLLGISIDSHKNVINTLYQITLNLSDLNYYALGIGLFTLVIIVLGKKMLPGIPSYLIAIILSVLAVYVFNLDNKLELVGVMRSSLPGFKMIKFDLELLERLFSYALSIAILGFIQVLSIVKAMEKKAKQEAQLNKEFVGQGITNIVCSFFRGFVITGSFTKTFANYEAGAKTRFSQMIAGLSVLIFMILFGKVISLIPIASLAAIVILVAYYMIDKDEIIQSFKTTRFDAMVFSVTFITTILTPRLDYAIYFGVLASFILVLKNTSDINYSHISYNKNNSYAFSKKSLNEVKEDDFIVINLSGTIHFNASENLKKQFHESLRKEKVFVIRMREIEEIDLTTIREVEKFIEDVYDYGGKVIICGVNQNLKKSLEKYGLINKIGEDNIFMKENVIFYSTTEAIKKAEKEKPKNNGNSL
ncbi:MAG: SulP family inorganic anion transporter [Halanaerobiaceae bacterium]